MCIHTAEPEREPTSKRNSAYAHTTLWATAHSSPVTKPYPTQCLCHQVTNGPHPLPHQWSPICLAQLLIPALKVLIFP